MFFEVMKAKNRFRSTTLKRWSRGSSSARASCIRCFHAQTLNQRLIMKRYLAILLAALTAITLDAPRTAKAAAVSFGVGVHINSVADFNAPLGPLGSWTTVGAFGRAWRPARVAVGWKPYSNGSWVWTSAGWFWQSDEPWAWATYHYGSWQYDASLGWVWRSEEHTS